MPKRSTVLVAAVALVAAAATAVVLLRPGKDVLVSDDAQSIAGTGRGTPGQRYLFGMLDVVNTSSHEVRFREVRPVDPTPGLVIDAIQAVNNCGPVKHELIGFDVGTLEQARPELEPRPVTDAVVAPNSASCWFFAITAHAETLGTFRCLAFDLVYTVGGRTQTHRRTYGIELVLDSTAPDSRAPHSPASTQASTTAPTS